MKKIGLTGGIGSGKTTVARCLEIFGFPVYYADLEARHLTNTHPVIISGLKDLFGENAYLEGQLNRPVVAEIAFADKDVLKKMSEIIHPVVRSDFEQWCKQQTNKEILFQEAAIIFEQGSSSYFDATVLVVAPEEERIKRVIKRDGISKDQVKARLSNQLTDEEKIPLADFIVNCDEQQLVLPQILKILHNIGKR